MCVTRQTERWREKRKGGQRNKIGWKDPGQQWKKGWAGDGEGELGCKGSFLHAVGCERIQGQAAGAKEGCPFVNHPRVWVCGHMEAVCL